MKTLLFYLTLSLGLLMQGHVLAQESDSSEFKTDEKGVRFVWGVDDAKKKVKSLDQKIDGAVEKIRKLAGDDITDELAVELKGLSDDDKKKWVKRFNKGYDSRGAGIGAGELSIAIVAIVFSLGMPIIILFMMLIFAHRKRRQKMEVMKAYLESGREVPAQVLAEFSGEETNNFRSGVKLIAIGAGVGLALLLSGNEDVAAFGLIPLFIGCARILFWKSDNKTDV